MKFGNSASVAEMSNFKSKVKKQDPVYDPEVEEEKQRLIREESWQKKKKQESDKVAKKRRKEKEAGGWVDEN